MPKIPYNYHEETNLTQAAKRNDTPTDAITKPAGVSMDMCERAHAIPINVSGVPTTDNHLEESNLSSTNESIFLIPKRRVILVD
jgi:hypothetical protein